MNYVKFSERKVPVILGVILSLLAGLFPAVCGAAETTGVTLSEVESRVLKGSPLIQKRIEGIGETRSRLDLLGGDYGFYLRSYYRYNVQGSVGTEDSPGDFRYRGDIDIEWELFKTGLFQNSATRESLKKMGEALQFDLRQTKADELGTVRLLFFGALKQKSLREGDRNALLFKERVLKEVEGLFKEKQILLSELMKVQHDVEKIRISERQHERDYRTFLSALALRAGLSGEAELSPATGVPPSLGQEEVKGRVGGNYQLASLKLKQQSIEAEPASTALWALSLFGGYTFDETKDHVHREGLHVGARLSVPLTIFGKAQSAASERDHRAKEFFYEREMAEQDIRRQIEKLYYDYLSDLDLLKLEEQNLQVLDEDIRLMEIYVKSPVRTIKVSNLDLLHKKAERALSQAQMEAKRYDLWIDYYRIYKFIEEIP